MLVKTKQYSLTCRCILCLLLLLSFIACSTDTSSIKEEAPFIPEESLREANELIKDGYYEEARTILETVKTRDTSQKHSILARLRIADTYFDEELYEEAVVEYESFLNLYPYDKYASYAQYKLAMCYFRRIRTVDRSYSWAQRALIEFKKLQRNYPRNPYMDIIENRKRTCTNALAEYEFYVGNFYFKKGSYNAAIGRFNGMLQNYPESTKVPDALYFAALSHESLGERDKAINNLTALINKFPAIELSIEAKKLIESLESKK